MKRNHSLLTSAVALALFSLGSQVQATAWVDYSSNISYVDITSTDPSNTTHLRTVKVTCPKAGHLVATATASFDVDALLGVDGLIAFYFSIAQNDPAPTQQSSSAFVHMIDSAPDGGIWVLPGSVQRTSTCTAGQTHTFYFVAHKLEAEDLVSATRPKLVVEFFDVKI